MYISMSVSKTVFEKVWSGDVASWPIFRSDVYGIQVILDIYPAHPAHVLVIPREPVDHVFDLEAHRHLQLFAVAKLAAERIQAVMGSQRVKYVVSGYDIAHVHLHLLPSYTRGDVEEAFESRPKVPAGKSELDAMRLRLAFPAELVAKAEHQLAILQSTAAVLPNVEVHTAIVSDVLGRKNKVS
jgi:histidine triad (HIT) family protein